MNMQRPTPQIYCTEDGQGIALRFDATEAAIYMDALEEEIAYRKLVTEEFAVARHLLKRMFDECGEEKSIDFIKRVKSGEHDVPSPWTRDKRGTDNSNTARNLIENAVLEANKLNEIS